MSTFDAILLVFGISVVVPVIVHRIVYGSVEQQSLRSIEKHDCSPERIEFLTKFLEDIRPNTDPELIKQFEESMEVRRKNAEKYWQ
jgi:hypothetical protein